MKILHIEDRFHPEMGYQINFFAKYHHPDNEFIILTSDSLSLWDKTVDEIVTTDRAFEKKYSVKIVRVKAILAKGKKYNIWLKGLVRKIEELNPDVVYIHAVESYTSLRLFLSKRIIHKYPLATDTHTLYNQIHNTAKFKFYYWFLKQVIFKKINKKQIPIFFTAAENQEIIKNYYKIKEENIYPCPIGTDLEVYRFDPKERKRLRSYYKYTDDTVILIYTGKMNSLKKPHLIFNALEALNNKNIKVFVIGSKQDDYYENVFRPAAEKEHAIILTPKPNTDLYKYYSMADIAVFPKENTLSALDAQACQLPVIMEEDQTNKSRLKHGGLVYKANDINDLSQKIYLLSHDQELRKKLASNGFAYISKKYNYKRIVAEMENVLSDHYKKFYASSH